MCRGDDDSDEESKHEQDDCNDEHEGSGEEGDGSGMMMPADVEAGQIAEGQHGHDDGESSGDADSDDSSGLEDAEGSDSDSEADGHGSQMGVAESQPENAEEKTSGGAPKSKPKLYDQSPEFTQLCLLETEHKLTLLRLPELAGCGISRHPAKFFWSGRYPGHPTKSVCWGASTKRTPLQCLLKVLRYVVYGGKSASP